MKSNVESTSDQKESEIKEESTGENPNESQPTTTSVVGALATEPLSSNQNTSIASSEVKQIQLIKMLIWTNNKKK